MVPKGSVDPYTMYRGFDCYRDCVRGGDFVDGERSRRGCTHHQLPPVKWDHPDVLAEELTFYLGRPAAFEKRGTPPPKGMRNQDWWLEPPEDIDDGCPAGWMICPFAQSVQPYIRRRTEGGGRVPNPRFDELTDRLAQDAALYFEEQEERLVAYRNKLINEKWNREHGSGTT